MATQAVSQFGIGLQFTSAKKRNEHEAQGSVLVINYL